MKRVINMIGCILIICLLVNSSTQAQNSATLPSNVEDGRCYAQTVAPTQYTLQEKKVLVRQGYTRVINHEAQYDTVTMGVMAHAETKAILVDIYDFEIVGEPLEVASDVKLININNEFDIRDEIKDAIIMKWNLSDLGMCDSPSQDCDLLDWVEVPVDYTPANGELGKAIEKGNQMSNAIAHFNIKVKGYDQLVPVEYRFYTKEILAKAPRQEIVEVAPVYKTVTDRIQSNEKIDMQWVEIVCPSKIDGFLIGQVQLALKGRKHYFGRINGIWTDMVQTSLENYQIENDLPIGKLDKTTVEALGLNYEMIINPEMASTLSATSSME